MATREEEKEYKKHTEIKTYKSLTTESVKGSARHSSKFSNEFSLMKDNQEKINALVRLSDHITSLDSQLYIVGSLLSALTNRVDENDLVLKDLSTRVDELSEETPKPLPPKEK